MGDFTGASVDFNDAIALNPKEVSFYGNRGQNHYLMNNYVEAIADYDVAITMEPSNGKFHFKRGIILYLSGSREAGCIDLQKSGELGHLEAFDILKFYCR